MIGIDPGITALLAIPEVDDFEFADVVLPQFPAVAEVEELCRGDVTAKTVVDSKSLPHVLSHKPAWSTCDAYMVGKMKNLRTYKGAFSRATKGFGDIVTMDHC